MPADEQPTDTSLSLERASIPWEFAGMPPVNPRDRAKSVPGDWQGLAGLAADVDYYGRRVWDVAHADANGEMAVGPSESSQRDSLTTLAELVRQSRPYIVQDQIDHYSTGSSSPYATVERDIAAYADTVVGCLALALDAWAREWKISGAFAPAGSSDSYWPGEPPGATPGGSTEINPFAESPEGWAERLRSLTISLLALPAR